VKTKVTWIVVADHQHARILCNDGPGTGLKPVEGLSFDTHLHFSRDLVSDRPGRAGESAGGGLRHAVEPRTDAHRKEARKFVAHVAEAVSDAAGRGDFDQLVLIAPSRALGEFREMLPAPVMAKLIGELPLDLTKTPNDKLPDHLGAFLTV
jgi:protein required for attachment to host cells